MKLKLLTKSYWKDKWKAFRSSSRKEKMWQIGAIIGSLVFAIILWGFVVTSENPYKEKVVYNVQTSFEGEAELLAKGFCIRGDRSEILDDVSVTVKTRIANYTSVNSTNVTASINVKNISEARTYELAVNASVSSALGTVQSVNPGTVSVEIDTLVTKTVPITTIYTGTLPDGYWADMDASTVTTRVDIEGAKTDLDTIKRAECTVDLTDCTSMIYSTYDIVFYDGDGNVVSSDVVVGTVPTCTVRIPIYASKEVPVDVEGALIGADAVAANHEIKSVTSSPATVRVVGEKSVVDAIESVSLETVNVTGLAETAVYEAAIVLPEGVFLPDDPDTATVTVEVRENTVSQSYDQVKVEVRNLGEGLAASLDYELVDVYVEGRYSLLNGLTRADASIWVDVSGLTEGTYSLTPYLIIRDEERTGELSYRFSVDGNDIEKLTVTIVKAS